MGNVLACIEILLIRGQRDTVCQTVPVCAVTV